MHMNSDLWGLGVGGNKGYNPRTQRWELGYNADNDPLVIDPDEDVQDVLSKFGLDELISTYMPGFESSNDRLTQQFGQTINLFNSIYMKGQYGPRNAQQYTYVTLLQKLLEAIQMPVPNPKNQGEMDYIDFSLLDRTIIEPEYVINMATGKRDKVELSLVPGAENQYVNLTAKFPDKSIVSSTINTEQLEETLSDIVHNNQSMRLENTDLFRGLIDTMVSRYCEQSSDLVVHTGKTIVIGGGLGIVIDTKVDQEIATFEHITIQSSKDKNGVTGIFNDLLPILRSLTDLTGEPDRYLYTYYDLKRDRQLSIVAPPGLKSEESNIADATMVMATGFTCESIQGIPMEKAELIRKEVPYLEAIKGQTSDNPLYTEEFDAYRESRSRIVHNSRASANKQKMVQQFTDIEF